MSSSAKRTVLFVLIGLVLLLLTFLELELVNWFSHKLTLFDFILNCAIQTSCLTLVAIYGYNIKIWRFFISDRDDSNRKGKAKAHK
jgi:hypothetical protein